MDHYGSLKEADSEGTGGRAREPSLSFFPSFLILPDLCSPKENLESFNGKIEYGSTASERNRIEQLSKSIIYSKPAQPTKEAPLLIMTSVKSWFPSFNSTPKALSLVTPATLLPEEGHHLEIQTIVVIFIFCVVCLLLLVAFFYASCFHFSIGSSRKESHSANRSSLEPEDTTYRLSSFEIQWITQVFPKIGTCNQLPPTPSGVSWRLSLNVQSQAESVGMLDAWPSFDRVRTTAANSHKHAHRGDPLIMIKGKPLEMHSGVDGLTRQRMLQAKALSQEARGGLNLGKKISVPKDVMMEELNLSSNRGSRMFQERQRRAEKFTLENVANGPYNPNAHLELSPPLQSVSVPQGGKENQVFSIPGKHSLVMNLQKTVAKKGNPNVLAPGYSGPLKEIPHEKFNTMVIPKSYCSPWREALGGSEELLNTLNTQLPQPPQRLQPANYRCFNRTPMPFGGTMASKRVIPLIGFEAVEPQKLPGVALDRMCRRPNFNRAPRGWGIDYSPESNEL
ncbi:hypothetical protein CCH79_00006057 [Gambusia affinis]|uniref:Myozenin 3a n=1 Tax=Gambusia affinis TaxID=33528 RepID=A0A315VJK0_GAMAF|nr:hypothetical protein CCH79_00006057 [Gambusia affinis]